MVRCSVPACPNKQGKCSGITFHKFPKDEARRLKWIKAVGREHWLPSPSSLVCSSHFTEDDMDRTSLIYVRLRQDAVPTILMALPNHVLKKAKLGRPKAKQKRVRDKVEHECWLNQQIEKNLEEQNHEASLHSDGDSTSYEPAAGSVVLATIKQENEAGEKMPMSVLLQWKEVGTEEPSPESPGGAPHTDEDNTIDEKPSLAKLLEWRDVETSLPQSELVTSGTSNYILPHMQSVLCKPDTPCELSVKRKSNNKATEPKWRRRTAQQRNPDQDEVEDEWDQVQQDDMDARAPAPEALLLECCMEEEVHKSEHAPSILSRCRTPQEVPVICATDASDLKLLKKQLYQSNEQLRVAKKRIRILMQNRRRFQKRLALLKGTCSELKSKNLLNEDKVKFLEKTLGGSYRELFERKACNSGGGSLPLNYSMQLREFATKLYFYSRDAYHYMRQTFQNCLPHPGTLRRWNNPYADCPPALNILNDEMSGDSASESNGMGEAISACLHNSECRDARAISSTD